MLQQNMPSAHWFLWNCLQVALHFDLPWNPGRIEQRNGRIDRKLQPAPEVYCHYFVLPQRAEDRVLEVLVRKTETIKKELGSLSKVIDDDIDRRLRLHRRPFTSGGSMKIASTTVPLRPFAEGHQPIAGSLANSNLRLRQARH
jgi:hypothetical protein